jgi:hypothetical protein
MGPHPAMQSWRLAGQITLGLDDARDGWLRLLKGRDQWLVRLEESGEFRLDGLPPGAYRLEFVFKNRTIELPVLSLSQVSAHGFVCRPLQEAHPYRRFRGAGWVALRPSWCSLKAEKWRCSGADLKTRTGSNGH